MNGNFRDLTDEWKSVTSILRSEGEFGENQSANWRHRCEAKYMSPRLLAHLLVDAALSLLNEAHSAPVGVDKLNEAVLSVSMQANLVVETAEAAKERAMAIVLGRPLSRLNPEAGVSSATFLIAYISGHLDQHIQSYKFGFFGRLHGSEDDAAQALLFFATLPPLTREEGASRESLRHYCSLLRTARPPGRPDKKRLKVAGPLAIVAYNDGCDNSATARAPPVLASPRIFNKLWCSHPFCSFLGTLLSDNEEQRFRCARESVQLVFRSNQKSGHGVLDLSELEELDPDLANDLAQSQTGLLPRLEAPSSLELSE